jgi:RHS repeat-associated protein
MIPRSGKSSKHQVTETQSTAQKHSSPMSTTSTTDQVGLPEELSDQEGNVRWRAAYKTWGATVKETWEVTALNGENLNGLAHAQHADARNNELEQNLRFQGQHLDRDTGLHYNTFRFYDADSERLSRPIHTVCKAASTSINTETLRLHSTRRGRG